MDNRTFDFKATGQISKDHQIRKIRRKTRSKNRLKNFWSKKIGLSDSCNVKNGLVHETITRSV